MNRNVIPLSVVLRTERSEPQLRRRQQRHTEFLGLRFALLEQPEVIQLIAEQGGAPYRYVVTPNAYHVTAVHDEPERLLPVYRGAPRHSYMAGRRPWASR